jgi:hypothetical protein
VSELESPPPHAESVRAAAIEMPRMDLFIMGFSCVGVVDSAVRVTDPWW